jgi:hypothetical protein
MLAVPEFDSELERLADDAGVQGAGVKIAVNTESRSVEVTDGASQTSL